MCKWGNTTTVELTIPANLSYTGKERKKLVDIDDCIVSIVKALNEAGIKTIASCCGHGQLTGSIILEDNRVLEIHPKFETWIEEQNHSNKVNIHGESVEKLN